jgi:hypothetical protein
MTGEDVYLSGTFVWMFHHNLLFCMVVKLVSQINEDPHYAVCSILPLLRFSQIYVF